MIVNTRTQQDQQGFNPNVDNSIQVAKATFGQKLGWFFIVLFTLGIMYLVRISWRNSFNKQQIEINQAASNINVNLTKRRETLIKLLEQVKGYMRFEKETLTLIAKYRSGQATENEKNQMDNQLANFMMNLNVQYEQYPQLKSDQLVRELMSTSQYLETEIAASRRLYNQSVTYFNSEIFTFPRIVLASSMKLQTFPMYIASTQQMQDVDMSSLSGDQSTNGVIAKA